MTVAQIKRVALIGFGEAGGILGEDLAKLGIQVHTTDILLRQSSSREAMLLRARNANVSPHESLRDAVHYADLVVSAVTSSASVDAATEAAPYLAAGQVYLDINSVSPEKKREIANTVAASGASFVESAVMAPVPPQRLKVPMLLGGPGAHETAQRLNAIGMNARAVSDRIGVASAIKMCRSVLVKGLEALAVECLLAARRYGAEEEVLASLDASYPEMGWRKKLPDYLVSRVAQHGRRRAAEMREVAETLKDIDLAPHMALATAERQDWLVDQMALANISYDAASFSWKELADNLRSAVEVTSPNERTGNNHKG
jgi:3-hydroxyisobutyrate dehydrogenase-like beta-hydroxyacid dehydrogenase